MAELGRRRRFSLVGPVEDLWSNRAPGGSKDRAKGSRHGGSWPGGHDQPALLRSAALLQASSGMAGRCKKVFEQNWPRVWGNPEVPPVPTLLHLPYYPPPPPATCYLQEYCAIAAKVEGRPTWKLVPNPPQVPAALT